MTGRIISSRTPEGQPNRCPICQTEICIEPSVLFGDAPCPACGSLLWFANLPGRTLFFERDQGASLEQRLKQKIAALLGVSEEQISPDTRLFNAPHDSLDQAELEMLLEDLGLEDDPSGD